MASQKDRVLDLTDLTSERLKVRFKVDNEPHEYDLLNADDLDPLIAQRLKDLGDRYEAIRPQTESEEFDQELYDKIERIFREQIRIISPTDPPFHLRGHFDAIPDDVLETLSVQGLIRIVDFFIEATGILEGNMSPEFREAVKRLQVRTGGVSSPRSRTSTRSRRRNGG